MGIYYGNGFLSELNNFEFLILNFKLIQHSTFKI